MYLNTFSSTYFAPAIIILGTIGNLLGLIVITRKKLKDVGPQITYIALFIYDCINFALIFEPYASFAFNTNVKVISALGCKLYFYIVYVFGAISPMLNVYISIERYISIAFSTRKHFLQKNQIQLAFIIALTLFNLALYVPIGLNYDIVNKYNQTLCIIVDSNWRSIIAYVDLTNQLILPSTLMLVFSVLIICTIFASRIRISSSRTFRKDVRFSFIILLLNIIYIIFSLPLKMLLLLPNFLLNPFFIFTIFLNYIAYSFHFYLMFSVNSLFRGEFFTIFKNSSNHQRNTTNIAHSRRNNNNNVDTRNN